MNWKPGDLAIIETRRDHDVAKANGKYCRLTKYAGNIEGFADDGERYRVIKAWIVDIDGDPHTVAEAALRKPPFKPGSWKELEAIYQPSPAVVVESG